MKKENLPPIDIRPDHWAIVRDILKRHVPDCDVWAFGSRAGWTAKPYSDLDLAVSCAAPLTLQKLGALRDAFSESDLPWKVDVVDLTTVDAAFRKIIEAQKVDLQGKHHASSEWIDVPLEDCLEALIDYRGKSPRKAVSGIPVISAKVVKEGRIIEPIEQQIEPSYYNTWMRRGLPDVGDVVLTTEGPLGEVARLDTQTVSYALGQRIVVLRGKKGLLDNGFLKFALQTGIIQARLNARATGTTVMGISQKSLREMPIPLPVYSVQCTIASVLSALDDKIELNRRMNETLEQMAQAIFKDWFVDFGPVRRKQEGARDPIAIMGGLVQNAARAAELAGLFPDAFGDDGLPVGWSKRPIRDVFEINPRDMLKKRSIAPYSDMASLPTSGPTANPPMMREFGSGMRFRKGDALLARITPCLENGKAAYVDFLEDGEVGWGSTEFIVLRAPPPVPKPMAYLLIRQDDFRNHAIRSMTGTSGRQRATEAAIGDFRISVADDLVYVSFGQFIESFFSAIRSNAIANETLTETRDYLLPKLMSGELRVRDAENIAEAAL